MAREAETRIGRPVRVQLFEDLDDVAAYDGIWANASLLHVPRAGLPNVLARVHRALKPGGVLYASFKSGGAEGRDSLGRYYNYLNADEVTALLNAAGGWSALDLKEGRGTGYDGTETGWVIAFARKAAP
jgi:SAM-dependent methyltransferase